MDKSSHTIKLWSLWTHTMFRVCKCLVTVFIECNGYHLMPIKEIIVRRTEVEHMTFCIPGSISIVQRPTVNQGSNMDVSRLWTICTHLLVLVFLLGWPLVSSDSYIGYTALPISPMNDTYSNEETPLLSDCARTKNTRKAPTPLPKFQIAIVLLLQICEPITSQSIYPYINRVCNRKVWLGVVSTSSITANKWAWHYWRGWEESWLLRWPGCE